jgi:hypothetical protein
MSYELHDCAETGDLERIKQLVLRGANIEETDHEGMTALSLASLNGNYKVVVYLVEHGAHVTHTDDYGMTALHSASINGNLLTMKYILKHDARMTERSDDGKTSLLYAAANGRLEVVQYLLSSEGGASITESDDEGYTALLMAANRPCYQSVVQWLLECGGAQITDTDHHVNSVWTYVLKGALPDMLKSAYMKSDDGNYVCIDGECVPHKDIVVLTAMLRVIVLHGGPPESLSKDLVPPLQQIVHDGARLRAKLPTYLARRRALLDVHCPLLAPLTDTVHGYEEPTTTDELWATGLGAP